MPGWGWAVLAVLMVVVIIAGLIYAYRHFIGAVETCGATLDNLATRFDKSSEPLDMPEKDTRPLFTQPLGTAMDRYADAHVKVIERKDRKRERRLHIWKSWLDFNK
ncbi:MAG: hypothetical protein PUF97_01005 [Bifidobacteriaceae bacterium]|nr:hypothetical protein [Bifidobacteriaceae bacterium]